ncbi:YagK/YfjJ domain-containing protein [Pseudomonas citronellolis]|uniref:YagK/YfjJ domain-containing protein n=1 Tax=Pseudomonas citronellolis TaxID=53408 RepID=UPI0015F26E4C|nr:inovirus-type Gp2 protein [Pseudomonas citronellolis]
MRVDIEEQFAAFSCKYHFSERVAGVEQVGFKDIDVLYGLKRVSGFVRDISLSKGDAFEIDANAGVSAGPAGRAFIKLMGVKISELSIRSKVYEFDPYVELGVRFLLDVELCSVCYGIKGFNCMNCSVDVARRLNSCVERIRSEVCSSKFQARLNRYQRSGNKNLKEINRYIDALFGFYSRLLVLRVDLSYRKEYSDISLEKAISDRVRLFCNARSNKIFSEMVGYVWKLEHGMEKGFHFHVMFFYDGSKVREDVTRAQRIGEYWKREITGYRGIYYNCNASKARYKSCGIGMINHDDALAIEWLRQAAVYLAKSDLYMKVKTTRRGMGKGKMPAIKVRRGRPRRIKD